MPFIKTALDKVLVFEPKVFGDDRGYFYESYNENVYREAGVDLRFVQDNQSKSAYGVLRGLHYQLAPYAQAKLVRVISGRVLDVVVDIRKGSPTYGKSVAEELSAENKKQLFIPKGFAHGFVVLSQSAEFIYKCDSLYNPSQEAGVRYNDPALGIDWQLPEAELKLSDKDKVLPGLADAKNNFIYGENS
jgi:dTDP-4-dehydrorhamnose 3,5-epimerase